MKIFKVFKLLGIIFYGSTLIVIIMAFCGFL